MEKEYNEQEEGRLMEYVSGQLDEKEEREVEAWIEEKEEHKRMFHRVRREEMWLRWGARAAMIRGKYEDVRRRIAEGIRMRWRRAVAAAAVVAGVGMAVWLVGEEAAWRGETAAAEEREEIVPGRPRAVLHLASGRNVVLGEDARTIVEPGVALVEVTADGELSYARGGKETGAATAMHRVDIPRGGEFAAVLEDGTRVWLNSLTELRYPARFAGESREVFLEGEAYFEVSADGRPFVVHAGGVAVRVLGTGFNVNTRGAGMVRTVLVEGSVEVTVAGGEATRLVPGELATWDGEAGRLAVERVRVAPHVAWKDRAFIFDNQGVGEIMETLSLWYDLDVVFVNEKARGTRLTGDLERYEDVRKLLYFFERTSDVRFEIDGRTVIVR
jgi:ferric-dicitrate binding protein FerR (iron transport regulator)